MKDWNKLENLQAQISTHIEKNLPSICKDILQKPKDTIQKKDLENFLLPIFTTDTFTKSKISDFLCSILHITKQRASVFDKYLLKILLFILEKNEFFILRQNKNMKLYLKILSNLKGSLAYLQEEDTEHIFSVIKGINPYGIGEEKQQVAIISSLVLSLVKNFISFSQEEFSLKFLMKHFKNIFNSQNLEFGEDFEFEGVLFWIHKLVEKEESKQVMIDFFVNQPRFLLKFEIKNVKEKHFYFLFRKEFLMRL